MDEVGRRTFFLAVVSGAHGVPHAVVRPTTRCAAQVVVLFEQNEVAVSQPVGGGETGIAAADDDKVDFAVGVLGQARSVAAAHAVAEGKVVTGPAAELVGKCFFGGGARFG